MEIYVARHGQTDSNTQKIMVGRGDDSLNEKGRAQARKLAKELKDIKFDVIYTSPLKRAAETSKIINKYHNVNVLQREALYEIDVGDAEGLPWNLPEYKSARVCMFPRFPAGESNADVLARVYPFLDTLLRNSVGCHAVLIVAHGNVCRIIHSYFTNVSEKEFEKDDWKNCELRTYDTRDMIRKRPLII